jgi:hypothetical protein
MEDKEKLMEKYVGGKTYPPLVPPVRLATKEAQDYRALVENKQRAGSTPRFRVVDRKGISYGCGYAHLLGWMYTPPDLLTLQTTTHIFTLEGKHLDKIEAAFMEEKVRELHEFNQEYHKPPEEGEPLIEHMDVKSRWEEQA